MATPQEELTVQTKLLKQVAADQTRQIEQNKSMLENLELLVEATGSVRDMLIFFVVLTVIGIAVVGCSALLDFGLIR